MYIRMTSTSYSRTKYKYRTVYRSVHNKVQRLFS